MDWALFFASKLGRWLASIVFTILMFGGAYWYGGHSMKVTMEARYAAQIVKSNKALDKELDTRAAELERESSLREILRARTRATFADDLTQYAKDHHEAEKNPDGTVTHNTGISSTGVRAINASIASRAGKGQPGKPAAVPPVK